MANMIADLKANSARWDAAKKISASIKHFSEGESSRYENASQGRFRSFDIPFIDYGATIEPEPPSTENIDEVVNEIKPATKKRILQI